ncbi:MAG: hypothetical protein FWF41_05555 [Betaproteobacteria bacterium]|nr:hypothetical protein [Betaproteobacteria bacterium]
MEPTPAFQPLDVASPNVTQNWQIALDSANANFIAHAVALAPWDRVHWRVAEETPTADGKVGSTIYHHWPFIEQPGLLRARIDYEYFPTGVNKGLCSGVKWHYSTDNETWQPVREVNFVYDADGRFQSTT